jgi:hypothetical protein
MGGGWRGVEGKTIRLCDYEEVGKFAWWEM